MQYERSATHSSAVTVSFLYVRPALCSQHTWQVQRAKPMIAPGASAAVAGRIAVPPRKPQAALTLKDTSSLLHAVFVTQDLSSSLHMYVVGSDRLVETNSFVS